MLSLGAEETVPAQDRVEEGKRRANEQVSSNYELLSLLTEMREEKKR